MGPKHQQWTTAQTPWSHCSQASESAGVFRRLFAQSIWDACAPRRLHETWSSSGRASCAGAGGSRALSRLLCGWSQERHCTLDSQGSLARSTVLSLASIGPVGARWQGRVLPGKTHCMHSLQQSGQGSLYPPLTVLSPVPLLRATPGTRDAVPFRLAEGSEIHWVDQSLGSSQDLLPIFVVCDEKKRLGQGTAGMNRLKQRLEEAGRGHNPSPLPCEHKQRFLQTRVLSTNCYQDKLLGNLRNTHGCSLTTSFYLTVI